MIDLSFLKYVSELSEIEFGIEYHKEVKLVFSNSLKLANQLLINTLQDVTPSIKENKKGV